MSSAIEKLKARRRGITGSDTSKKPPVNTKKQEGTNWTVIVAILVIIIIIGVLLWWYYYCPPSLAIVPKKNEESVIRVQDLSTSFSGTTCIDNLGSAGPYAFNPQSN